MENFGIFVLSFYLYLINPFIWIKVNKLGIFFILKGKDHVLTLDGYKEIDNIMVKKLIGFTKKKLPF